MEKVALVLVLSVLAVSGVLSVVSGVEVVEKEFIVIGMPGLKYVFTTDFYRVACSDDLMHYLILYPGYLVNDTNEHDGLVVFSDISGWTIDWDYTGQIGSTTYGEYDSVELKLYTAGAIGFPWSLVDKRYTFVYMMRPSLEASSSGTLYAIYIRYSSVYGYSFLIYRYNTMRVGAYDRDGYADYESIEYQPSSKAVVSILYSWYSADAEEIRDINGWTIYTDTGEALYFKGSDGAGAPADSFRVLTSLSGSNWVVFAVFIEKDEGDYGTPHPPWYTVLDFTGIPGFVSVRVEDLDNGVIYSGDDARVVLDTSDYKAGIWKVVVSYQETGQDQDAGNGSASDSTGDVEAPTLPQLVFITSLFVPVALFVLLLGVFGDRAFPVLLPTLFALSWTGLFPVWLGLTLVFLAGVYALYVFFFSGNNIGLEEGVEEDGA